MRAGGEWDGATRVVPVSSLIAAVAGKVERKDRNGEGGYTVPQISALITFCNKILVQLRDSNLVFIVLLPQVCDDFVAVIVILARRFDVVGWTVLCTGIVEGFWCIFFVQALLLVG